MLSYHNDENLKNLVVSEMKNHQKKDQFIKGTYGEICENGFKGCAVGCTIDSVNKILGKEHPAYAPSILEGAIGIPEWLSNVQDTLFEGLPNGEGSQFAVDFLSAIPVGVNLEPVKWKFCSFILKEGIERIINQENLSDDLREMVVKSMKDVLKLHENAIKTGVWDIESSASSASSAASSATKSASSAASSAAWSASSAAWSAARSAAKSAEGAAASASSAAWSASSAAWSAAWSDEWSASSSSGSSAYRRYSDELIRILKETEIGPE